MRLVMGLGRDSAAAALQPPTVLCCYRACLALRGALGLQQHIAQCGLPWGHPWPPSVVPAHRPKAFRGAIRGPASSLSNS
jgi:hypothetical protein